MQNPSVCERACMRVYVSVYTWVCAWMYLTRVWRRFCIYRRIGITRSLHVVSLTFVFLIFTFCLRKLIELFSLFVYFVNNVIYHVLSLEIMTPM